MYNTGPLNLSVCALCPVLNAEMAFTAQIIPAGGIHVGAELIHVSLFTQHLLRAFNCILDH